MPQAVAFCKVIPADGVCASDFVYLEVNHQFEAFTGLRDVIGKRVTEVLPRIHELDPELMTTYEAVALTGVPQKFERFLNVLGQWHSISVYCPEIGFFVVVFDVIDERKKVDFIARQWQRAFDESHSGIAVVSALTGKITSANAAYARWTGYSIDELTGKDITRLYPENAVANRNAVLLAAGSDGGSVLFETSQVRKDGTAFPVLIDITVIRAETGEPVSHVKIIHDLTELKRTSQALRTSEARARSLLENASQAILTANAEGRIVEANAMVQRLFGYTSSELIGESVNLLLPQKIRDQHAAGDDSDLVVLRKDGTEFPVEISVSYIAGHPDRLSMAFVSDITARKKAGQERERLISELKDALAEKTVLLQEVHHRVKNNLAIIAALLGMQASMLQDERARIALEESERRVLSMARIHEFLYATEHLDRVAFGKYVEQLANELFDSYAVDSSRVSIRVVAEDIDLPVHQAIPCGLILNELLTNVLKYAFPVGRSGVINVHFVRLVSGDLSLVCRDDGIGMPENFQWQNAKSLGLRIIRILAAQIDGSLTLEPGSRGTSFQLTFPCLPANSVPTTASRDRLSIVPVI